MPRSTQILLASVLVATGASILLLHAPIIPALVGGIGAGIWIWYRSRA